MSKFPFPTADDNHLPLTRATQADIHPISNLLALYADKGLLLPLTDEQVLANIGSFAVARSDADNVIACAALKNFGGGLYEIRSLAVHPDWTGHRIGSSLVQFLLDNSDIPERSRIFALTYRVSFFLKLGFSPVEKTMFPQKIWHDCENCPKKDHCDEQAVMIIR